jgi:hypothetical protein
MKLSRIGIILALVGSLALGTAFGYLFLQLFKSNVPQQWLSSFQANTSPFTFIGTGTALGLVIFAWTLVVAWLAGGFRGKKKDGARSVPTNPGA